MQLRTLLHALSVLIGITVGSGAAHAEEAGKPFLMSKGTKIEIPGKIEELKDKQWIDVAYPEYAGHKPRIAVVYADEKLDGTVPQATDAWSAWIRLVYGAPAGPTGTNPFNHIEDLLSEALGATHRFTLLDRTSALDDVTREQDMTNGGRVERSTGPSTGRLKGAEFIVKPTVVEIDPDKDPKKIDLGAGMLGWGWAGGGFAGINLSKSVAFCRLYVKVVDATSGEIVQQFMMDGTAARSGLNLRGMGFGFVPAGLGGGEIGLDSKKKALLSDAMKTCANKVAYQLTGAIQAQPWSGLVASVSGDRIYVNGGSSAGLEQGAILRLVSKGQPIPDPENPNGPPIGFDQTEIGEIRVVSVQEKFAICEIANSRPGAPGPKSGDLVRMAAVTR